MQEQSLIQPSSPLSRKKPGVKMVSIGLAVPPHRWDQEEILNFIESHFQLSPRAKALYRRFLMHESISKRAFALNRLEDVLDRTRDQVQQEFENDASDLANESLLKACQQIHLSPKEIDFLVTTTCTGYTCPGLSSRVAEKAHCRADLHAADVAGMGCGAAIPGLELATNFVKANPGSTAALVSVELSSAAFYSNNDPDVIVSNSIFSDGAAAVLLSTNITDNNQESFHPTIRGFGSLSVPAWRDKIRFVTQDGYLKNVLDPNIPTHAAEATDKLLKRMLQERGMRQDEIAHWIVHPGGKKVLDAIANKFHLAENALDSSRKILKNFGNMSSPSVLFVLKELIQSSVIHPNDWGFLSAFGAGFSTHGALLEF